MYSIRVAVLISEYKKNRGKKQLENNACIEKEGTFIILNMAFSKLLHFQDFRGEELKMPSNQVSI